MLEKEIEKKVCTHAKNVGFLVYKFTSPSQRGVPDRVLFAFGRTLFIEFKAPGKHATELQLYHLNKLSAAGMDVIVIDSVETGRQFVEATYENFKQFNDSAERSYSDTVQ